MIRGYVGFDDTDTLNSDRGTGKVARWFNGELPEGCRVWGVIRQQLFIHEDIPFTSHNSSACVVMDIPDICLIEEITARAASHIERCSLEGSDPGLCVTYEGAPGFSELMDFSRKCTHRLMTQKEALEATRSMHLSGHGGTCDGIIGAAAAVGLTAYGWTGRFIEYGKLRDLPETLLVSELDHLNILLVSLDRDGQLPAPEDLVCTKGWLRPRLWGKRPILPVTPKGQGIWESLGEKRTKAKGMDKLSVLCP